MAEIPERSMWQPTMSSITEHAEQAMSFVNEMDRLRQIHREQFLDIDDHFNFDTSIDIFPYIFSGIVDENEAVSAIIKDLDSIAEKKTLGEAVYSYEYSPAINLLTSLTSRYENHFPIEGIELLKRIDMYTLNKEQFRSINFILASFNHHYELLPQSIKNHLAEIFTELDLNPMQQRYKSDIDALENFTDIFLTNLVGLGYEKKIFDFIASQRITYRPNYALALTACADKGFSKEVFEIVRDKTTYLPNYDITLAECAKQGMQEDILTIIEQAKEKPYNAYGPELFKESLIDCLSSPNDKIASRIRALLPESSLGYDIATFEMILIGLAANGYSKEMFEIAIKNKNISISAYIITAAVMKNSELIEDAYRWLKQNRNSQGSERLMEALAYAGKEKEMMNILKYSPRKNPKQIFNILDICKQKGLTTEVEQYCKSNFKISKPDPNEVVNEKKSKLSTLIREQFKILKLPTSHPLRKDLKDFVSQLSAQESQFLLLLTYNYGILHPVVTSFISKQTDMESANIWKLGSSITMLHNGLTGIFVHKLPENNAQVWNELSEETQNVIPIAPILRLGPKIQDTRIIASRYCGVSVKDVFSILNLNLGNPKERIKGRNPMTVEFAIADMYYSSRHPLIKDIVTQVSNTLAFLEEKRIDHIHPHWENFVIELIDEDYLTNYFLENPNETINTVPYREDAFSFDILQFNEITNQGKKKWKTVVRLIDFDLATHIFDKDPKNK